MSGDEEDRQKLLHLFSAALDDTDATIVPDVLAGRDGVGSTSTTHALGTERQPQGYATVAYGATRRGGDAPVQSTTTLWVLVGMLTLLVVGLGAVALWLAQREAPAHTGNARAGTVPGFPGSRGSWRIGRPCRSDHRAASADVGDSPGHGPPR